MYDSTSDRARATAAAAQLLVNLANRAVEGPSPTEAALRESTLPLLALDWTREVCLSVGTHKLNLLLRRLRSANFDKVAYESLKRHLRLSWGDTSQILPAQWESWRQILIRFNLFEATDFQNWLAIIAKLATRHWDSPHVFRLVSLSELDTLAEDDFSKDKLVILWYTLKSMVELDAPRSIPNFNGARLDIDSLVRELKKGKLELTSYFIQHRDFLIRTGLGPGFLSGGPGRRIDTLRRRGFPPEQLDSFLRLGSQINVLSKISKSFAPVASGISTYLSFCDLRGLPRFPPTETQVIDWSALFKPGRTFMLYLAHLRTACEFFAVPTLWASEAVSARARGLKKAHVDVLKFPNFVTRDLLINAIELDGFSNPFVRVMYVSFTFLLRVPSEALRLVMAGPHTEMIKKSPQKHRGIIGVRKIDGIDKLIIKFIERKNKDRTTSLIRRCTCGPDEPTPHILCPVHAWWPWASRGKLEDEPLFPQLQFGDFNEKLRAFFVRMGVPDATLYTSKCFRRGGAMAAHKHGSGLASILRAGAWSSGAFRLYLDLSKDESEDMASILLGSGVTPPVTEGVNSQVVGPPDVGASASSTDPNFLPRWKWRANKRLSPDSLLRYSNEKEHPSSDTEDSSSLSRSSTCSDD